MVKAGTRVNLSIPQHKELSTGILLKLISLSGMTVDELLEGFMLPVQCSERIVAVLQAGGAQGLDYGLPKSKAADAK